MAGGKLISTGVEFPDATTQTTSGLPLTGGALTGAVTTTSTFDGRDVAADGVTADAALPKAGGTMTGTIAGFTSTGIDDNATSTAITIDANENVTLNSNVNDVTLTLNSTNASGSQIRLQTNGTSNGYLGGAAGFGLGSAGDMGFRSQGDLALSAGGTVNRLTLDSSNGNATLATGNLVIGTSGKGIDFSATSDGSGTMTSEVLDDYEEGTFTPSFNGVTGGAPWGYYTKIGRTVTFTMGFDNATTTAVLATFGGLPFTAAAFKGGVFTYHNTWATGSSSGYVIQTSSTGLLLNRNTTSSAPATAGTGKYCMMTGVYQAA